MRHVILPVFCDAGCRDSSDGIEEAKYGYAQATNHSLPRILHPPIKGAERGGGAEDVLIVQVAKKKKKETGCVVERRPCFWFMPEITWCNGLSCPTTILSYLADYTHFDRQTVNCDSRPSTLNYVARALAMRSHHRSRKNPWKCWAVEVHKASAGVLLSLLQHHISLAYRVMAGAAPAL